MKKRGAIIGFGQIAEHGHWPTYANSSEVELAAISDRSTERQAVAKTLLPHLHVYSTAEELLNAEELDFVDICTPPSTHAALALQALEKNLHVLCEKPLTLQRDEYEKLLKSTQQREKTVFTVHNWKYAPIFVTARSMIQAGRIGPVWHVQLFTQRDKASSGSATSGQSAHWRSQAALAGGGVLVDHGWHAFYLLLDLVNAEPQKVQAKMAQDEKDVNSLEDIADVLVEFPEATGYIHLTWRAHTRRNHMVVQGHNGTLLVDDHRLLLTTPEGGREEIQFDEALSEGSHHPDWFKNMFPDFLREMNDPSQRGNNFKEVEWCLALTNAAYESHRLGFKKIDLL